ncbi:MAG TPA: HNH endonuclease family protein [Candidatus Nanopelagicaceae bacterium]
MAYVTQSNRLFKRVGWLLPIAGLALSTVLPPATATVLRREATATQVISQIPVKGRAPKTGYSRAQFGAAWADVDHNGCDTRNDILKRDLTAIVFRANTHDCVVLTGVLRDPYSGTEIRFTRGVRTSQAVQIDHVVSLSNAWQTGAFKLTLEQRTIFANDPLNLLAVEGKLNSQKGDGDAATWLPPRKSYRCDFVARQVAVKAKYGLWMTPPEEAAIVLILKTCPEQALPK